MKLVIIGHRGVGKSTLARRLKEYFFRHNQSIPIFDLDQEIAMHTKKSIDQIFSQDGEATFRDLERAQFENLTSHENSIIIAGAGFEPLNKQGFEFLWLQRPTDEHGRIFTDRPRLDTSVSPLVEYLQRFEERERKFSVLCDEILILTEGFDFLNSAEERYFTSQIKDLGGIFTVFERHIKSLQKKVSWGVELFELRDDLLTLDQIENLIGVLPKEKILLSFRDSSKINACKNLVQKHALQFDWPLEYPFCESLQPFIVSSHQSTSALLQDAEIRYPNSQIKWAANVDNFVSLAEGYEWQKKNPSKRSFLPMSQTGIWKWYRLWMKQPLSFFRIDRGSTTDQPTLLELMRQNDYVEPKNFAAVLGDPVSQSRSPGEHFDFFAKKNRPFFNIRIQPNEFEFALKFLEKLGLSEAAVTSPLKELAFKYSRANHLIVQEIAATNTLALNKSRQWIGTNTDIDGVRAIAKHISYFADSEIVIWGGGGTLGALKKVFPNAFYYSSRTGQSRNLKVASIKPKVLIWAVGRKNFDQDKLFPPSDWQIEMIIDLNYAEDSPGRECALKFGCTYFSGIEMFKAQAQAQRKFWSDF